LEDNLDQSILREEQVVDGHAADSRVSNGSLSSMPKDERARVEVRHSLSSRLVIYQL
jgi:hypothetical protein